MPGSKRESIFFCFNSSLQQTVGTNTLHKGSLKRWQKTWVCNSLYTAWRWVLVLFVLKKIGSTRIIHQNDYRWLFQPIFGKENFPKSYWSNNVVVVITTASCFFLILYSVHTCTNPCLPLPPTIKKAFLPPVAFSNLLLPWSKKTTTTTTSNNNIILRSEPRANGGIPISLALVELSSTTAAAPSFKLEAFPAVMVPSSCSNRKHQLGLILP